jgi:hypothetical protein
MTTRRDAAADDLNPVAVAEWTRMIRNAPTKNGAETVLRWVIGKANAALDAAYDDLTADAVEAVLSDLRVMRGEYLQAEEVVADLDAIIARHAPTEQALPSGLCGNKEPHDPHVHDSTTLGRFQCRGVEEEPTEQTQHEGSGDR